MSDDVCFVYFSGRKFDLAAAAQAISNYGMSVRHAPGELFVSWPDGPGLRVCINIREYVHEEAVELAEQNPSEPGLSQCTGRYEISIDDFEATMQEASSLMEVQDALVALTDGFVYRSWNGVVTRRL